MLKKIFQSSFIILFFITTSCKIEETKKQTVLKSYITLTTTTVTTNLINRIINNLNIPGFDNNQVQQLIIHPVKVYKITYRTNYKGKEILASGAVTIPETSELSPILGYHHGTIFKDNRVPSKYTGGIIMEPETALNIIFASTGFILAAPDLIGYGDSTDKLHPYHLFHPTMTASLDMLRAVKELCSKLGKNTNGKYFITGYSEGAYAAMSVQREIQKNHSKEFPIVASSLGGGAYFLSKTVKKIFGNNLLVSPAYAAFLITSYNEHYEWRRDLSQIFREPYNKRISGGIFKGNFTQSQINNMLTRKISKLFTNQFIAGFRGTGEEQLKAAFVENDLHKDWSPKVPTRLYHGTWDTVVPEFNSKAAFTLFQQSGAGNINYIPLKRKNHATAIFPWIKATILWFNTL